MSQEDIEKLVKEAEEMKGQDDLIRKRIEAKNGLENYAYNIKNALKDDKFKDKFSEEEKTKIEAAVENAVKWIEANPNAETEDFSK